MEIVVISFTIILFVIFLYSLVQLNLLINYQRSLKRKDPDERLDITDPENIPYVTIQLPLYNEKPVVERLLRRITDIEYPPEKLEIQVLDDSTDDSVGVTSRIVAELRSVGHDIQHLRRSHRDGYKAGALKEGLKTAKGEFIAIFDSDFLPGKDWLIRTLPDFRKNKVGVVQARWGHLNRNYSLLTKIQAFLLDFHFILEQNGRNAGGHFINFNGTAGIWRKICIIDAGNWQGDTLTEDLDLSYRAQLKGWEFKFLASLETLAELPITIKAARSQQFRWNKGAAENFQKNFKRILTASHISMGTRIHSFFHLLNSSLFLLVFLLALLSLPLVFLPPGPLSDLFSAILTFFSLSTLIFFISYWVSYSRFHGRSPRSFLRYIIFFFTFISIAMGFSINNSIAVLEGHLGLKSEFIRTPKFNITSEKSFYENQSIEFSFHLLMEILMVLMIAFAIYSGLRIGNYQLMLFHLMLFFGFSYVLIATFKMGRFRIGRRNITAKKYSR